ncbi:hypothetical protein MOQ72_39205 [Saccharopolyspora sp. K220]|uniref:hypothetical protein n=1 Tax=Saccharopolyspora soli TaxID=2926618 RepID=UPI001F56B973|nr:hypothetical protein [Saccharopolyspora soli]MCI2423457.1 hypothetical protein [Saccharopolyspora soli]
MARQTLYHFTSQYHLSKILASGKLNPTESNIGSANPMLKPYGTNVGPKVVWLLDTPDLGDHSHGLRGSFFDKTAVRITVTTTRAIRWKNWKWTKRMNPEWKRDLLRAGGGMSAAGRWWVVVGSIPQAEFARIEQRAN